MKRWWSIGEFRSTARGTGWGSVRGTRNWGADQTWTLKINGVQWNGKAGWRDSPASWDLSSTAADKIRTTLILMMCLIWACWEWWENSETYNYLYMPTVTILACVILTLFNWNYEPTVTILACVILTLFNSNYAVTVIIAILLFILYNAEPNTEGYYLHIVGCHCSFGLVHFKRCYLCLWSIHIVYYHRKKCIGILRQEVFIIILARGLLWSSKCTRRKVGGALPHTSLGELTAPPQNP